jgi:hypothetical protein
VVILTPRPYYPSGKNLASRSFAGSGCCGGGRNLLFLREILAVRKTVQCVTSLMISIGMCLCLNWALLGAWSAAEMPITSSA